MYDDSLDSLGSSGATGIPSPNLDQLTFLSFYKLTYVFSLQYDGIKILCAQV